MWHENLNYPEKKHRVVIPTKPEISEEFFGIEPVPDPVDLNGALNEMEGACLRGYEAKIEMHMGAFLIVGSALKEIRDQKLYRGTHDTFEIYVEKRFDLARQYAYRL